jgi:hypothetical protein
MSNDESYSTVEDEQYEAHIAREEEQERKSFALGLFEFNATLNARIALGHGIDRDTVSMVLRSLADAIEFQDVAENMSPVGDGNILAELDL